MTVKTIEGLSSIRSLLSHLLSAYFHLLALTRTSLNQTSRSSQYTQGKSELSGCCSPFRRLPSATSSLLFSSPSSLEIRHVPISSHSSTLKNWVLHHHSGGVPAEAPGTGPTDRERRALPHKFVLCGKFDKRSQTSSGNTTTSDCEICSRGVQEMVSNDPFLGLTCVVR